MGAFLSRRKTLRFGPKVAGRSGTTSSTYRGEPNYDWKLFLDEGDIRNMMPSSEDAVELSKLFASCYKVVFKGISKAPAHLENGGRVLEVGCAHGIWATEMAFTYPKAEITGIDYSDGFYAKTDGRKRPPNLKLIKKDYVNSLPFENESFDYVYYRPSITDNIRGFWPKLVPEIIRVTRPGGYIELLVGDFNLHNTGPLTTRMQQELTKLMTKEGSDVTLVRQLGILLEAQDALVFVHSTLSSMPVAWGGPIGEATHDIMKNMYPPLLNLLLEQLSLAPSDVTSYVDKMIAECRENSTFYNVYTAYARKSQFS